MNRQRLTGRIARLIPERGFGFIKADDDGLDYFFHMSELRADRTFMELEQGEAVTFIPQVKPEKGPRASDVTLTDEQGNREDGERSEA